MAAKEKQDIAALSRSLIEEARRGVFRPVYILMGDEPYYPDSVCQAIIDNCIDEFGKDFNENICYGADVNAERIVTEAREFPMMAERRLIVVKEAQMLKDIEKLDVYCTAPLDSTVLVLLLHKATVDRRKSLYKAVQKTGVVLDSPALRDYEVPRWIESYYRSRGLQIEPSAAQLMAESAGTELSTIVVETDKLLKNLPEGATRVSEADVEKNVGISRQFSVFELTKELSYRNGAKALKIAAHIGSSARFAMPMAVSALYTHFNRILKYAAVQLRTFDGGSAPVTAAPLSPFDGGSAPVTSPGSRWSQAAGVDPERKARALAGVNPYFYKEYDVAVRNYPLPKAMAVMSLLCEYDYLGKGGDGGAATPDQLIVELVAKILAI